MSSIEEITAFLVLERDKIQAAIDALHSGVKRRGRPPGNPNTPASNAKIKGHWTPEQREAASLRMKAAWKRKKRAKA